MLNSPRQILLSKKKSLKKKSLAEESTTQQAATPMKPL
jgi:hypothetical protein